MLHLSQTDDNCVNFVQRILKNIYVLTLFTQK